MPDLQDLGELLGELETYAADQPSFLAELVEAARKKNIMAVSKMVAIAIPESADPEALEQVAHEAVRRVAKQDSEQVVEVVRSVAPMAQGVLWPE